jgi:SRSO17 transposase
VALDSHFGAWVICTEHASSFQVIAFDQDGTILVTLEETVPPG